MNENSMDRIKEILAKYPQEPEKDNLETILKALHEELEYIKTHNLLIKNCKIEKYKQMFKKSEDIFYSIKPKKRGPKTIVILIIFSIALIAIFIKFFNFTNLINKKYFDKIFN